MSNNDITDAIRELQDRKDALMVERAGLLIEKAKLEDRIYTKELAIEMLEKLLKGERNESANTANG